MKVSEWAQRISNSDWFQNFIIIVILLGGILAGLQTDTKIHDEYLEVFYIADIVIVVIFVAEMLIYMLQHGKRFWRYFRDPWHLFDFVIILASGIPLIFFQSHSTSFVVVLRLARVLRLTRLFEKYKKFKMVISTIGRVLPSLISVVGLLLLLFYIFGVAVTDLFGKYSPDKFGTLWTSMETLYFVMFNSWGELYSDSGILECLNNGHFPQWGFVLIFLSFQLISALILLNFFVGLITSDLGMVRETEKRGKIKSNFTGHTLILGWNDKIYSIISELREANLSRECAKIVILASKEKVEMDFEIEQRFKGFTTTKIQTISGNTTFIEDLKLANAWESKSIIILNEGDGIDADYKILKTIIALLNYTEERTYRNYFIVAEIYSDEVKERIQEIDKDGKVVFFNPEKFLTRLVAQAVLNPNVSKLYYEILGFMGNEFYISSMHSSFENKTFKEALLSFEDCCLVGIISESGNCILNPPMDYCLQWNDSLVLLAEDSSKVKLRNFNKKNINYIYTDLILSEKNVLRNSICNVLILGYNLKIPQIIDELNGYFKNQEDLKNFIRIALLNEEEINNIKFALYEKFKDRNDLKFKIEFSDEKNLEKLLNDIDTVIVLANFTRFETKNEVDTNTLYYLSKLNAIKVPKKLSIIAEFLEVQSAKLVSNKNVTDYIIGSNIIGPVLAQLSEQKELIKVFDTLFVSQGAEIYVRNVEDYVKTDVELNFATIVAAAIEKNETAIGVIKNYREDNAEFILNPRKSAKFVLTPKDRIIVLAEEM